MHGLESRTFSSYLLPAVLVIVFGSTLLTFAQGPAIVPAPSDEFVGPFPSWADVKRDYGAVGDGQTDDTAALQRALDDLRKPGRKQAVLYLPSGVYRIQQTLRLDRDDHHESKDIGVIGESPGRTVIRWEGDPGGVMFEFGAWYAKLSRLTLDGRRKAATAIAHGKRFATYNELSDLVIRDVQIGIEAGAPNGQGIAETMVLRCQFQDCSVAAISLQNFNSLDWFIWDSMFEDCGVGVTNTRGAGNFHVYQSLFLSSLEADLAIGNTEYFSFRDNASARSKRFFVAKPMSASAPTSLERNRIFDTKEPSVQVGNLGPLLLLDNQFRTQHAAAVEVTPKTGLLAAGNAFVSNQSIVGRTNGITFDNSVVPMERVQERTIALASLPAPQQRRVFEVPSGSNADDIQKAIDASLAFNGQRPIVHLPPGRYPIDRTLRIPANADVQLVGDAGATRLEWTGDTNGPLLHFAGPARATLRDLTIHGGRKVDGILVEDYDQLNARVFMDQANVAGAQEHGLLVSDLDNANVQLHGFNHADCRIGVKVIGGPAAATGKFTAGRVAIFGGASSNNQLSYDLERNGYLLVRDTWYESATEPRFMRLSGQGRFTLHGAKVAVADAENLPAVELDGFQGSFTLLNTILVRPNLKVAPVVIRAGTTNASVLALGSLVGIGEAPFVNESDEAKVAFLESFRYTPGGGAEPIAAQGEADPRFIRLMLAQTRRDRPRPLSRVQPTRTDLRLFRVRVRETRNGIVLRREL